MTKQEKVDTPDEIEARVKDAFDPARPDLVREQRSGLPITPGLKIETEKRPEEEEDPQSSDQTAAAIDPVITSNPD